MLLNKLGEPLQSAYRAAHSTETALVKVKDDIMTALHHQQGVFLVLLDLSAAFDTVTHSILFIYLSRNWVFIPAQLLSGSNPTSVTAQPVFPLMDSSLQNHILDMACLKALSWAHCLFPSTPYQLAESSRSMVCSITSMQTIFSFTSNLIYLAKNPLNVLYPNSHLAYKKFNPG